MIRWKRRIRARSFSKCLRYSSQVVLAITLILPLLRAGFIILARSLALLLAAPAPLIICASSMNNTVLPRFSKALSTNLKRSSKSPRYLLPASILLMSKLYTVYSFRNSGTFSFTILKASPSAIAVLPTPGSPTRITLFLLRRPNARAIFSSSSIRPITGSIFSFFTPSFKFVVNALNALSDCPLPLSSSSCSPTSLFKYSANLSFSISAC